MSSPPSAAASPSSTSKKRASRSSSPRNHTRAFWPVGKLRYESVAGRTAKSQPFSYGEERTSVGWFSTAPFTATTVPVTGAGMTAVRAPHAIVAAGPPGAVYFVDDNFIGNQKAALELLPHLIEWQRKNGYRVRFACEATLNIAQNRKILELMREGLIAAPPDP